MLWLAPAALAQAPLSAIDWLSDSLTEPQTTLPAQPDIATTALPGTVEVAALGGPVPDAVGLLPASLSGLPFEFWGVSSSGDIARRMRAATDARYPAIQDLYYTLLLAELDPPADSGPEPALFLSRLDTLIDLGALDQAEALVHRAGTQNPKVFQRAFDIALLMRNEDALCAQMRATPAISPDLAARIFCLARGGDWQAAALALETGRALDVLAQGDQDLLSRFLEEDLAEQEAMLLPPKRPDALRFRLYEAIGEPLTTTSLPLAFSHVDIAPQSGWKAQLEAAERLARSGAIEANQLLGIYTARRAAGSGGVWNRVEAIQALEAAIGRRDTAQVGTALLAAWNEMQSVDLEVPFAAMFADSSMRFGLQGEARVLAFKIGLLGRNYVRVANAGVPEPELQPLADIALGRPGETPDSDRLVAAIQDGFRTVGIPVRLQELVSANRFGEAVLRAMELFESGANGDLDELTDAIIFLRAAGLEDTARRGALQLILLDRRG